MKEKPVKIGIIGAGNRSKGLAGTLRSIGGVEIAALCDPNPERLNNLAGIFHIDPAGRFTGHGEMLESRLFDAVVVTSPDHTHHEVVLEAAKRKKHIFCEKPMALQLEHCMEMQQAAATSNVLLMMGFCLRYNNIYRRAKNIIASGEIGKVRLVNAVDSVERGSAYFFHNWMRLRKNSGGLLLQKATHSLDIINWLVDSRPSSVYALGTLDVFGGKASNTKRCANCGKKNSCPEYLDSRQYHSDYLAGAPLVIEDKCVFAKEIDIMDNEMIMVSYENGVKASYTECAFTPDYKREFSFVGDLGRLDILDFYTQNGVGTPFHEIVVSRRHRSETVKRFVQLRDGGHGGGDPAMMEEFIAILRNGNKKPLADGNTGVMSTAIAVAAERSIETRLPASCFPDTPR